MAKWLRRLGHEVTVLTTSAYGEAADDAAGDVVRTADAQRWRARLAGQDSVGAMFDSPTYSGRPHPLSRILVPEALVAAWLPFARSRALRLHAAAALRLRDHHLAARVGPRGGLALQPPRHALGRRRARRMDVRVAAPQFPTAAQRRLDGWLERRWLGAADAVVCVSEPAAADLRRRGIATPRLVPNGWDPESAADRPPHPPACSTPTGARSSTRGALAAMAGIPGLSSPGSSGSRGPTAPRPQSSSS